MKHPKKATVKAIAIDAKKEAIKLSLTAMMGLSTIMFILNALAN